MGLSEEQLKELAAVEELSAKELEIFSSMTPQELEEYRQVKFPEYIDLKRVNTLVGSGRLEAHEYMVELAKFRKISNQAPTADDAAQMLVERLADGS